MKEISRTIKKIRKDVGWTQEQLASHVRISRTNISKYETGKIIPPASVYVKILKLQRN